MKSAQSSCNVSVSLFFNSKHGKAKLVPSLSLVPRAVRVAHDFILIVDQSSSHDKEMSGFNLKEVGEKLVSLEPVEAGAAKSTDTTDNDASARDEESSRRMTMEALEAELDRLRKTLAASQLENATIAAEKNRLGEEAAAARRAAAEAEQKVAALNESIENESIWQYFKPSGRRLPPLHQAFSEASSSITVGHTALHKECIIECNFQHLSDISEATLSHCKTAAAAVKFLRMQEYSSEASVQLLCHSFLSDMIFAAGVPLSLLFDTQIGHLRADFWVLSLCGIPIGAIEVKNPPSKKHKPETMEKIRQNSLGQLFDYMAQIRSFYGVSFLFGILTNYQEWTICWMPDSDAMATSETVLDVSTPTTFSEERVLHVSKTYRHTDDDLGYALVSALRKMQAGGMTARRLAFSEKNRLFIRLSATNSDWERITFTTLSFNFPPMANSKLYLLQDFRGGAEGRVWLACSGEGCLAVIKFVCKAKHDGALDLTMQANIEAEHWRSLGFANVEATTLNNRPVIVMPFALHISFAYEDEKHTRIAPEDASLIDYWDAISALLRDIDPQRALHECIERCAKAKLVHEDIQWRHVGAFPVITTTDACPTIRIEFSFIDLGVMRCVESEEVAREAMAIAEASLRDEADGESLFWV